MKGLTKHHLIPYPRILYIGFLCKETINSVAKNFVYISGDKILHEDFDGGEAYTLNVECKKDNKYCIIVLFKPEALNSVCFAHEAYHVVDCLVSAVGLSYINNTGNEHVAYYIGHVVSLFEQWKINQLNIKKMAKKNKKINLMLV